MNLLASQGAPLTWLFLMQLWIRLFWFGRSSQRRGPFAHRVDKLLVLLVPAAGAAGHRLISTRKQETMRALRRFRSLAGLRGSARRWRGPLRAVCAQGYQAA